MNRPYSSVNTTSENWSELPSSNVTMSSTSTELSGGKLGLTALSAVLSTLVLVFSMTKHERSSRKSSFISASQRSTTLPGFGILGDRVNEFLEIFLDALAVYVHNDNKWDCQRRMLCEANQRAADYGTFYGTIMYFTSLALSVFLRDQKVSDSMEAMRRGRQGQDCSNYYPKCPYSL